MGTSGTYTVTYTAASLITAALRALGVIDPDESITTNEQTNGIEALNNLLFQAKGPNNRMFKGVRVWQNERATLTLSTANASYTMYSSTAADVNIQIPEEIKKVLIQDTSNNIDTPLSPMSFDEYESIPAKSQYGTPQKWYYERTNTAGTLYFDCKPSSAVASANAVQVIYRQPLEIITDGTQDIDIPNHYYRAVRFLLARDMAVEFPDVSDSKFAKVERLASESLNVANSFEPENTDVYYQPGSDY